MFGKTELDKENQKPSPSGYNGDAPGSEPETQALMEYVLKYDFRVGISYHSMGREIIYDRPQLGKEFNAVSREYAKEIHKAIGYKISEPQPQEKLRSGYISHFFNGNTLKPFITIETTDCYQPSTKKYFQTEYKKYKLYLAPIKALALARKKGYYDYKIYKDGSYVRDIMDKAYGEAVAERIGGELVNYKGKPILHALTQTPGSPS